LVFGGIGIGEPYRWIANSSMTRCQTSDEYSTGIQPSMSAAAAPTQA
jgi:hypothetical protein